MKKKVLICGAGSIGIYLGTLLHSKGHEVYLFGRRKLKEVSDEIFINKRKFNLPSKIFHLMKKEKYDFIFITTKLYDFFSVVKLLKKFGIKAKIFAAIQNGLMDLKKDEKILKKRIVPICVFSGFNLEKDKLSVNSTCVGWKTENSKEGKEIFKLISQVGIKCSPEKDLDVIRAEKTIVNCTLNALSAIEKKSFKDLFNHKETRERIEKLFSESYDVLKHKYDLIDKETMKKNLYKNWSKLNHFSSTYSDLVSRRKLETPFFNGYIVQLGKEYDVPVDENKKVIKEINLIINK